MTGFVRTYNSPQLFTRAKVSNDDEFMETAIHYLLAQQIKVARRYEPPTPKQN